MDDISEPTLERQPLPLQMIFHIYNTICRKCRLSIVALLSYLIHVLGSEHEIKSNVWTGPESISPVRKNF